MEWICLQKWSRNNNRILYSWLIFNYEIDQLQTPKWKFCTFDICTALYLLTNFELFIIDIYDLRRKRNNIVFKEKYTYTDTDTELTTHRPACVHVVPGNVLLP